MGYDPKVGDRVLYKGSVATVRYLGAVNFSSGWSPSYGGSASNEREWCGPKPSLRQKMLFTHISD